MGYLELAMVLKTRLGWGRPWRTAECSDISHRTTVGQARPGEGEGIFNVFSPEEAVN